MSQICESYILYILEKTKISTLTFRIFLKILFRFMKFQRRLEALLNPQVSSSWENINFEHLSAPLTKSKMIAKVSNRTGCSESQSYKLKLRKYEAQ